MYIDKRTLNPFFRRTNSTPQDLLDWVEFLMKECSDMETPCIDYKNGKYMKIYDIYGHPFVGGNDEIGLDINYSGGVLRLWWDYVDGNKQPLLDAIKEFKEKYKL